MVGADDILRYMLKYIEQYRVAYTKLISPPPAGNGYPPLLISPYITDTVVTCYCGTNGVAAIWGEHATQDLPPPGIRTHLTTPASFADVPEDVQRGIMPAPTQVVEGTVGSSAVRVEMIDLSIQDIAKRLYLGVLPPVSDPVSDDPFWIETRIARIWFSSVKTRRARYIPFLEIVKHLDDAAWDPRSAWVRAEHRVRADFAHVAGPTDAAFSNQILLLAKAIADFRELLRTQPDAVEDVFHAFLEQNPILLDVYGEAKSKPQWHYPVGEKSAIGKQYVEPDFILKYPGSRYKLVELERPSKAVGTKKGQTNADVTQAAFQIAEWRDYISKHYNLLEDEFPHISADAPGIVIISRSTERSFARATDFDGYRALMRNQFKAIDILTYDDLLAVAEAMFARLAALR